MIFKGLVSKGQYSKFGPVVSSHFEKNRVKDGSPVLIFGSFGTKIVIFLFTLRIFLYIEMHFGVLIAIYLFH